MSQVLGVIVLARNGDRLEYYQDPQNYGASFTETTPLGEVSASVKCVFASLAPLSGAITRPGYPPPLHLPLPLVSLLRTIHPLLPHRQPPSQRPRERRRRRLSGLRFCYRASARTVPTDGTEQDRASEWYNGGGAVGWVSVCPR
jgi:hypothetical protein